MKFVSDILAKAGLVVDGNVTLNSVANATTDTDKFLTIESSVVKFRTGAQLLSDIGGQPLLTNPITGTGTAGQVAFYTGTTAISGDSDLYWDNTNKRLGVGATTPYTSVQIGSTSGAKYLGIVDTADTTYNIAYIGHNGTKLHIGFSNSNTSISERNAISINSADLYVGIGVSAPVNRLQIGSMGATGFSGNHLAFGNGAAATAFFQGSSSTQMYLSTYLAIMPSGSGTGNLVVGSLTNSGYRLDVVGTFRVTSTVTFDSIANAITNTDRFLVSDAGVLKYRTAAQLLSDIGGQTGLNGTGFVRMSGTTVSYVTGTSSQFVKADGSLDSSTYLTSSSLSSYVPYTGATTSLNLGANNITAQNYLSDGNGSTTGGYFALKQYASSNSGVPGYTSLYAVTQNSLYIRYSQTNGTQKNVELSSALLGTTTRQFVFPDNSGTFALTSDIPTVAGVYLPLSGGTLTGALGGTSATFSSSVTANQLIIRNSSVPAAQFFRDLDVTSVGAAGQGIEFGARSGATFIAGAAIYGVLDNPATTGSLVLQTLTAGSLTTKVTIASTGAATFSSSVTTSGGGFVANMGSTNTEGLIIQRANTSSNAIIKFRNNASDTWILGNRNTGDETFRLYNYNLGSDVLTVTNNGNFVIGGTVASNVGLTIYGSNAATIYQTPNTGTGAANGFYVGHTGDISYVWNYNNFPLVLATNNTERLRITNGGDVRIGPDGTAPVYRLEVQNTVGDDHIAAVGTAPSIQFMNANSGPANWGTVGMATATNNFLIGAVAGDLAIVNRGTTAGNMLFGFGSAERMRLTSAGQLRLNTYTSSSAFTGTAVATLAVDSSGNVITVAGGGGSQWVTSGSDIYYATGNVGIGSTASPTTRLDVRLATTDSVNGTVLNSYPIASFIANGSGGGTRGLQIGAPTGGVVSPVFLKVFGTSARFAILNQSNSENFTVLDNGQVGIGINNPSAKLHVFDSTTASTILVRGIDANLASSYMLQHGGGGARTEFDGTWYMSYGSAETNFGLTPNLGGGLVFWFNSGATTVNPMTLKRSGNVLFSNNVGIGTTTLLDRFHVAGGISSTGLADSLNGQVGSIQIGYDGTNGVIRTWNSSPLLFSVFGHYQFNTNGSERLRITSGGNLNFNYSGATAYVNINQATSADGGLLFLRSINNRWQQALSTPGDNLLFYSYGVGNTVLSLSYTTGAATFISSVTAGGNFTTTADGGTGGLRLTLNNTGASQIQYAFVSGGIAGDGNFAIRNGSVGSNLLVMTQTGATTFTSSITCTALTETSSVKIKENIAPVTAALEKVDQLKPVSYNKKGSTTKEIGLIAEDVFDVFPEFVLCDDNGEPVGVHYSRLTAVLIESVKELKNKITELEKRN